MSNEPIIWNHINVFQGASSIAVTGAVKCRHVSQNGSSYSNCRFVMDGWMDGWMIRWIRV
jgi:hypothetical protein